jgi:hypothetical protein
MFDARKLMRFRLRTLLIFVTILGIAFAVWHRYGEPRLRRMRLIRDNEPRFELKFEQCFTHTDGNQYRVLVFDTFFKIFWGTDNQYKIVVTSDDYRPLASGVFGGKEMDLYKLAVSSDGGKSILKATCLHRPMWGGVGTYRYEISPQRIVPYGEVVWDDPDYWDRFQAAIERHANQTATRK